jgi:hypothetical protein
MFTPTITTRTITDNSVQVAKNVRGLSNLEVYVGIPESDYQARQDTALDKAAKLKARRGKRYRRLMSAAEGDVSNAQLMFIHTNGSMALKIPARPVIEPAIEAEDNKAAIVEELKDAMAQQLDGKPEGAVRHMKRAGMEGQNAARRWFTDPRNHWAPNRPGTIARKGSSRPLIDTGILRSSIVWVLGKKS